MKTLKLSAPIGSPKDMNELVDIICKAMNQDTAILRDKFKMVTQANSKSLNDLCKQLKLKLVFDYTSKNIATVEVLVNESFDISSLKVEKPEYFKKKESSPEGTEEFVSVSIKEKESNVDDDEDDPF